MKRGRNQRRRQSGANPNRALDSNGPDVRIRGTAMQIYDKYQALARDASSAGDRVKAENYLQHAEHYFRLIKSMQPAAQPSQNYDASDANAAQPSVDDKRSNERRTNGEAKAEDASTANVEGAEEEATVSATSEEPAAEAPAEEKKPRRRRTRRTVKKSDDSSDEKAEEAIAS